MQPPERLRSAAQHLDERVASRLPRPVDADRGVRAGQRLGVGLLRLLYRARVTGQAHVPSRGPVILVANHVGFIDGPLGFITSPRPVHFLVKRAYFVGPVGWLLRGVGQIPITQRSADREALTSAREVLRAGGVVGVFPEGTRGSGEVASAQQGAAFLALGTKAVVVPVALSGTAGRSKGALPRVRSRLSVTFGEPFDLAGVPEVAAVTGRERVAVATEALRMRLAEHVRAARI